MHVRQMRTFTLRAAEQGSCGSPATPDPVDAAVAEICGASSGQLGP